MDLAFPYTRYACPCSENTSTAPNSQPDDTEDEDSSTFNPHDPRANYALCPIENLLYCDDCHHIRCPKCITEEMIYWFCPNCLFEVPSSGVKSDGNRCTRHCYNCPLCSANLSVSGVKSPSEGPHLRPEGSSSEAYILNCHYCDWSSLDIGVSFPKPTKITEQLNKIWKARHTPAEQNESEEEKKRQEQGPLHHDTAFANLQKFYKDQLSENGDQTNPYSNSPYSSPANLQRIMSLYGGLSHTSLKKAREKPQPMREAGGHIEGLATFSADDTTDDDAVLERMKKLGIAGIASQEQRLAAPLNYDTRFTDELWPVATKLLVRRGKRCRTCRQFLARPEQKTDRLKYKIRLLSANHIQRLSVRPLNAPPLAQTASFRLRADPLEQVKLQPNHTQQYVLTVRNPIFEPVRITLSTPARTPGKVASRVTILCPSFTIGHKNENVWDEAMSSSTADISEDGSRRAAMASLTGSTETDRQPEAGKVWERHRNSTSVILEVVPGALKPPPSIIAKTEEEQAVELAEDDDILEIPIHVRVEWEGAVHPVDHVKTSVTKQDADAKEHRELAYWCVLGLGRIAGS